MSKAIPTLEQKRLDKMEDYIKKLIKSNSQLSKQIDILRREAKRNSSRISSCEVAARKLRDSQQS